MDISALALKLIFILIPGAIATMIVEKLTIHKDWDNFKFVINAIVLGVISYLVLQLVWDGEVMIHNLAASTSSPYIILDIWRSIADTSPIPYSEVILSAVVSIPIGLVATYIDHYSVLHRVGRLLKITNKYGNLNLFSEFLNNKNTWWVSVRDLKNNLCYFGCVQSFSETDEISELVLGDVEIYTSDSCILLNQVSEIYLSFNKSEIIIEKNKIIEHGTQNTAEGSEDPNPPAES